MLERLKQQLYGAVLLGEQDVEHRQTSKLAMAGGFSIYMYANDRHMQAYSLPC